jgi:hypothetical protein
MCTHTFNYSNVQFQLQLSAVANSTIKPKYKQCSLVDGKIITFILL